MGVPQVLHGISIVFLSLRKSLQDWQTRSGGRISRRRFFLLRPRLPPPRSPPAAAAAIAGASALADGVSATVGAAESPAACSTAALPASLAATARSGWWGAFCSVGRSV